MRRREMMQSQGGEYLPFWILDWVQFDGNQRVKLYSIINTPTSDLNNKEIIFDYNKNTSTQRVTWLIGNGGYACSLRAYDGIIKWEPTPYRAYLVHDYIYNINENETSFRVITTNESLIVNGEIITNYSNNSNPIKGDEYIGFGGTDYGEKDNGIFKFRGYRTIRNGFKLDFYPVMMRDGSGVKIAYYNHNDDSWYFADLIGEQFTLWGNKYHNIPNLFTI